MKLKSHNDDDDDDDGEENAFVSVGFKGKCHKCGKIGDKGVECWSNENALKKKCNNFKGKKKGNSNLSNIACFGCGQKGHKKFNCPTRIKGNTLTMQWRCLLARRQF